MIGTKAGVQKFVSHSKVRNYKPSLNYLRWHPALREGWLCWADLPAMLLDPHVNIGYRVLCAPISRATWKVKCDNREAGEWIDRQIKTFWKKDLSKALMMLVWGSVPGECTWTLEKKTQYVQYDGMSDFRVLDTRPLCLGRTVVGFRLAGNSFQGDHGEPQDNVLQKPRCFWVANEPECGNVFGKSRLVSAWSPWMEKAGAHGAKDARKLWNFKCAFNGGILRHPTDGEVQVNGTFISCQEYAMRVLEMMETGHVMTLPNDMDQNGKPLWDYIPASVNSDANTINNYPNLVGQDIWLGMGIMPEVIQASQVGSGYAGRSVPFLTFLASEDQIIATIIAAICHWIVDPGLEQNFGEIPYEVEADSLVPRDQDDSPENDWHAQREKRLAQKGQGGAAGNAEMTTGNPQAIMGAENQGPVRMSQGGVWYQPQAKTEPWTYVIQSGHGVVSQVFAKDEPKPVILSATVAAPPAVEPPKAPTPKDEGWIDIPSGAINLLL